MPGLSKMRFSIVVSSMKKAKILILVVIFYQMELGTKILNTSVIFGGSKQADQIN